MNNQKEKTLSQAQKFEAIIVAKSNKDIQAFNRNEKSYELWTWLQEELVCRTYHKKESFLLTSKAFSKIVNPLASMREKGMVTKLSTVIEDTQTVKVTAHYDLDSLTNSQRYRFNAELGIELEMLIEDDQPTEAEMYGHCF